jgi:hypothetical protein
LFGLGHPAREGQVAFSAEGVLDVTRRYTARWADVEPRRREAPEAVLAACIAVINADTRRALPSEQAKVGCPPAPATPLSNSAAHGAKQYLVVPT